MQHAVLGGGKRLRPFLLVESAALFGADRAGALLAGCALELVHCYSLVHDDLPAMDDDDLRRGRPTVHKAFDEATAILAGDALLTLAFDVDGARGGASRRRRARRARAGAGARRRPRRHGRRADARPRRGRALRAEARAHDAGDRDAAGDEDRRAAFALPPAPARSSGRRTRRRSTCLDRYGRAVGQAFQIADDLLDLESDAATLGKAAGKDAAAGKATLVSALGPQAAHARLDALVAEAEDALTPFAAKADTLRAAARFVAERKR